MFNLQQFIADHVICRPTSMFAADIEANKETLQAEIRNKSVCVIGGAGSIGSSFIKAVLPFKPSKLIVIDLNENGLAELTRDLRSTYGMYVPAEYRAYTLNFAEEPDASFRTEYPQGLQTQRFIASPYCLVHRHQQPGGFAGRPHRLTPLSLRQSEARHRLHHVRRA